MAMEYDAFISYARGVATPIAQALREGISKYNKKWNQAVSTKVYLDEKSLGVAPSLTDELKAALGCSGWLVLLLTRRAAEETSWVGKEVEYWLENKSADRILLVACEGKVEWDEAKRDFSDDSDCIPSSLRGRFEKLPCWMDLSWFGVESDAGSPRFQDAVIALYSRVHKISPDEARMANDSNLRRNRRLAKGAIIVLSALLVISIIASIAALWQTQRAQERERAALALAMSAKARTMANENVRIASLLAVQAYRMAPSRETKEVLHEVAATAPRLVRMDRLPAVPTALAAPPKGNPLIGTEGGKVYRWVVEEGRLEQVLSVGADSTATKILSIRSSETGEHLLVQYGNRDSEEPWRCALWSREETKELGHCDVSAISPDGKTYILDQAVYGEKVPNGKFTVEGLLPAVAGEFSWHDDTFVMMRAAGDWERRHITDPSQITESEDSQFGNPNHNQPEIAPGGQFQTFHMGADDRIQIRRMISRERTEKLAYLTIAHPLDAGASPTGETIFAAGEEGLYWSSAIVDHSSAEVASRSPELLSGLVGVRLAKMPSNSRIVAASSTHIALWDRNQMSRIARFAAISSSLGASLGIQLHFSPDGTRACFCYAHSDGHEMVIVRLEDMHVIEVKEDSCVVPRWSTNGEYVVAADIEGRPKKWYDLTGKSVVIPDQLPELTPMPNHPWGNYYDENQFSRIVRNGSLLHVLDRSDQARLLVFNEPHGSTTSGERLTGSGLSPDGRYFFSASIPWEPKVKPSEAVQVWTLDTEKIIQGICGLRMAPLANEEWRSIAGDTVAPTTVACA